MRLRFDESKDGKLRATITIRRRVDFATLAYATALLATLETDEGQNILVVLRSLSKSQITNEVTTRLTQYGDVDNWPYLENYHGQDEIYEDELLEAAEQHVKRLWPVLKREDET